jgi:hypothetical protein
MTKKQCRSIADQIEAFVDGELSGVDRLNVGRHLAVCGPCAETAESHRAMGEMLRRAAQGAPASSDLGGLASGVLSRLQAERAQSWPARLGRGVDDWHWLLVGSGSLAATFIVTLFVSAVLIAGPVPERKDSLAGVYNNLGTSAGTLLVVATPVDDPRNSMLMQVVDSSSDASGHAAPAVAPTDLGFASEADLVRALAEAVTQDGRLVDLGSMPKANRDYAEKLLGDIHHMRSPGEVRGSSGTVTVRQIVLRANASVSAKGL